MKLIRIRGGGKSGSRRMVFGRMPAMSSKPIEVVREAGLDEVFFRGFGADGGPVIVVIDRNTNRIVEVIDES